MRKLPNSISAMSRCVLLISLYFDYNGGYIIIHFKKTTALLRYYSHTINFTYLKFTTEWLLVYSE